MNQRGASLRGQSTLSDFAPNTNRDGNSEDNPSGDKKYQSAEWLHEQYWKKGLTQEEIGNLEGVSKHTISKWMKKLDIETRSQSEIQSEGNAAPLKDREWLKKQYHERGLNSPEIAKRLGVAKATVLKSLERNNIETRSQPESLSEGYIEPLRDSKWLKEQYHEMGLDAREIAEKLGVSKSTVLNRMETHGVERRSNAEARAEGDISPLQNGEWLRNEYRQKERSMSEIAEDCGVSIMAVRGALDRHGIEVYSISEAKTECDISPLQDEEWLRKQYHEEGLTMREIAEIVGVSVTPVQTWIHKHDIDPVSNIRYPEHLDHLVRSSWELLIAELLIYAGVDYEYESLEIDYGENLTYTPDFVTDTYVIEVKGRLHEDRNPEQKARRAMRQLDGREYVVVGTELPADIHIPWKERESLLELFE